MKGNAPRLRASLGTAVLALAALTACGGDGTATTGAEPPGGGASRVPASASPPATSDPEVTEQIRRLERARDMRIGAYAIDTGTGRAVGHRADEAFPFASTFKAIACGAVLRKARNSDPGLLDRVIRYKESDLSAHSPITEKHVKTGMTVADLCHATITQSDNTAGNLVLKQIGGPAGFTAFLRSLGDQATRSDRWEPGLNEWRPGEKRDTTAPRAWAGTLHALTVGDALAPADRKRLTGWMKATVTGDERIRAGLPDGWTAGDKTGTGGTYGSANDIAIAWPPSGAPVVIAILTTKKTKDAAPDEQAIARTTTILIRALR
ncbi:class A beta-lactamase [Actinomadura livida]|uniref:Beta-lactamase n=1 Tax=Actinomadura livida TaxID=79909 RepID=A0A7W7IAJ2_9ACTN|nr:MULTISPECIES: class A beta-lactamase [Actinomadura]MBB4773148.1 beta-lactamase class A [Actinomadura catellatispora]GGU18334.1 beta-lactamase [Actinomadura livida]